MRNLFVPTSRRRAARLAAPRARDAVRRAASVAIEALEDRRLFTVTLNNGLPTTDPNFFAVTLDVGNSVTGAQLGQTSVVNAYKAFVSLNNTDVVDFSNVLANQGTATTAVAGATTANSSSAVSTVVLNTGLTVFNGKTFQNTITINITSTLATGSADLQTSYTIEASQFENINTETLRFYQFLDAKTDTNNDNTFLPSGAVASGNLVLTTINPDQFISEALKSGTLNRGASLTGFGADLSPLLEQAIGTGTFNPPATGTNNLPLTQTSGFGATFGSGDVQTALVYAVSGNKSAQLSTDLNCTRTVPTTPVMQVFGLNNTFIPSGDTAPLQSDGTDFGPILFGTDTFQIRNLGGGTLSLPGRPQVQILGPDASNFSVSLQPLAQIGPNLTSTFQISFIPQSSGRKMAEVVIYSNDTAHNPYVFDIAAGTGTSVAADVYESDNDPSHASAIATDGTLQNHSINADNDVDWSTFTLASPSGVDIQTNGAIGDTVLALYSINDLANPIATNDNNGINLFSRITIPAATPLPAGKYFVKVFAFGQNNIIPAYTLSVAATDANTNQVFATVSNGVATVIGTALSDVLAVDVVGASLRATLNGQSLFFPIASVTSINIDAGGGNDVVTVGTGIPSGTIHGGTGSDSITGNEFGDLLYGGGGNDTIVGGVSNDVVTGGGGNDSVTGGGGSDSIYGNGGADTLVATGGGDCLIAGGAGDDSLIGGNGNDTLYGRAGNDTLNGGLGDDQLFGGPGSDAFAANDGQADTVDGTGGADDVAQVDSGLDLVIGVTTLL